MNSPSLSSQQNGFTLFEALVALAIFTMAAVGLTRALAQMGLATVEAAEKTWRVETVQSYLEEISKRGTLEEGEETLRLKQQGEREEWIESEIRRLELHGERDVGLLPDLFVVELKMYSKSAERGGDPILLETASTWRYQHLYAD